MVAFFLDRLGTASVGAFNDTDIRLFVFLWGLQNVLPQMQKKACRIREGFQTAFIGFFFWKKYSSRAETMCGGCVLIPSQADKDNHFLFF